MHHTTRVFANNIFENRVRDYFAWFKGYIYVSHDSYEWKYSFSFSWLEGMTIFNGVQVAFKHHMTRVWKNAILFLNM